MATAVCSALAASIFTAGVFGTGMYFMQKNMNNNTQSAAVASETTQSDDSSSSDSAQLAAYKNGKKVLTIPEIAEQVGPSVVGVINKTTVQPQKYYDPFSGRYYYSSGDGSTDGQTVEQGSGSGIIFQDDGYIVTNQHVIDGASEISVILNTGDEFTAKLVGQDTKTDLAVLKTIRVQQSLQPQHSATRQQFKSVKRQLQSVTRWDRNFPVQLRQV